MKPIDSNLRQATSVSVSVLITCYNRREKTLNCLEALLKSKLQPSIQLQVYLVDDGSTDDTAIAVQRSYPYINILTGNGNLFWNGGMRLAFAEATQHEHDYYLWLNDDTLLYPYALDTLLNTSAQLAAQGLQHAIVVGSTQDPVSGAFTYGGVTKGSWWHPFSFGSVNPGDKPKRCDTMNGNCILIPRSVQTIVGNLEPSFSHYLGDYDYGLRAQKSGCTLWVAPHYVGVCSDNPTYRNTKIERQSLSQRVSKINQSKGMATSDVILLPFDEWRVFSQRHGGWFWVFFYLLPYRRLLWLFVAERLQNRNYSEENQAQKSS